MHNSWYVIYLFNSCEDGIDGLVQHCSNSSALAMELVQSCTKPSVYEKEIHGWDE